MKYAVLKNNEVVNVIVVDDPDAYSWNPELLHIPLPQGNELAIGDKLVQVAPQPQPTKSFWQKFLGGQ